MTPHSRTGLVLAGCLAVMTLIGCAQNQAYEISAAGPQNPKADGLVVSGNFRAVVIKDVDNDGHPDIVGGASTPGMVTISYGDGKGAVSEPQILPVHGEVLSVAVADFNEDGLNDIAFSVEKETTGIRLWINQSNRQWKQADGPIKVNRYQSLKTADVNGDGHMDLIGANSTADANAGVQVWLGNGKGTWPLESGPTTMGRFMDVALADLNKDGVLDLIAAGWGTYGALRVWLGEGSGKWSSISPLHKGSYYGVSVGDLNRDGNPDILAATYRDGIQIFMGDGKGNFKRLKKEPSSDIKRGGGKQTATVPQAMKSFWNVLAVDLDGDHRMDIVASSPDSLGLLAWLNRGEDGWKYFGGRLPSTGIYYGMALADLNNDGHPDLCAASDGEGIQIWPGDDGAALKARQMEIEQLSAQDRLAVFAAPLENDVFATVNGIAEYKIGPGDILEITYWEASVPKKEEIVVRPDGKISFGFVEDLPVNGLTISGLDKLLTKHIKNYVRKPRIDVIVKEYNSKTITLLGAIQFRNAAHTGPGVYNLSGKTTLLEILTKAGGPAEKANLSSINIRRKNGDSISLDLFRAIHQGDPSKDFVLNDGDVVFIPTLDKDGYRVYVFGEVAKPGTYTFTDTKIRLMDAISEAGGPTVFASESDTKIVRGDITRPEVISANLKSLVEKGDQAQNVALVSGDLVYVPRSGWGGINNFAKRIRPLLELILWPARTVNEWDRAYDVINNNN
jgi:protein involved in polysaccharide export with SLBB domain/outer membrane lipoprotein SlyB